MEWYDRWEYGYDLSRSGIELSFTKIEDMNYLLVVTDQISSIEATLKEMVTSKTGYRYHIVGDRGLGKSTLLNWLVYRFYEVIKTEGIVPVYTTLSRKAANEEDLEFIFFRSLLEGLFGIVRDMEEFTAEDDFREVKKRLSSSYSEYCKKLETLPKVSFELIYEILRNQLAHLCNTFRAIVFLIDGLDKQDTETALLFLKDTQERLNQIVHQFRCVFIDAADPSWRETLDTRDYSGVRGTSARLKTWTLNDVELLIKKRLAGYGIYATVFEKDALENMVASFQGNPREILMYATELLHYGKKKTLKTIGAGVTKDFLWSDDDKERLLARIRADAILRIAYEKIKEICKDAGFMNILRAPLSFKNGRLPIELDYDERAIRGITTSTEQFRNCIETLVNKGCLKRAKVGEYVELSDDVSKLFSFVRGLGKSLTTLPVVLGELELKIKSIPIKDFEEIFFTAIVEKVISDNRDEWLTSEGIRKIILDNEKTRLSLEGRYGPGYEKSIVAPINSVLYNLRKNGKLMYDEDSSAYKTRPPFIEQELADIVRSKEVFGRIAGAQRAVERAEMTNLMEQPLEMFRFSYRKLVALLGKNEEQIKAGDTLYLLESLGVGMKDYPLEMFLGKLDRVPERKDEAIIRLQVAISYVRRVFEKIRELEAYEPSNKEIVDKIGKWTVGIFKQNERKLFNKLLLKPLMEKYHVLVSFMTKTKMKECFQDKVPEGLHFMLESRLILPCKLLECPVCREQTVQVSEVDIDHSGRQGLLICNKDRVDYKLKRSGYTISREVSQSWPVWLEEYTRHTLEQLPCRFVSSGMNLRPVKDSEPGIVPSREVDVAVVYNGLSIDVECTEVLSCKARDDMGDFVNKAHMLGLFDVIVIIYHSVDDETAFESRRKEYEKILWTVQVDDPSEFKRRLLQTLSSIDKNAPRRTAPAQGNKK